MTVPAPALVLHQDPRCPMSETIRLVLGRKQLAWQAVTEPTGRTVRAALTGGQAHTPVLQVGADLYCDGALICEVLEHARPEPPLFPPHLRGVSRVFAQWASTTLMEAVLERHRDPAAADAMSAWRSYVRRIASMVDEHDYLFGADACVADFATFGPLWFARERVPGLAEVLALTPSVGEWMERLAGFGHGLARALEAADAVALAAAADPQPPGANLLVDSGFQDDHGIALGRRVTVTPESFGQEATQGELIAATRTHYTLRRADPRAGMVHVHFPRIGYVLRAVA